MDVREELTEAERTALVDVAGSAIKGTMVSAKALFSGVETTVPAAAEAMRWLKGVARQMENGERMEWRAPSGFLVQHDYLEYDIKRVDIKSCGQHKIMVREATERTRIRAMQNAIAPNLVHSLDATHLVFTALRMEAAGLDMVAIHDSFGTHPCDVPKLAVAVREAFVELYDGTNVLADFIWQTSASGAVPKQGTLDVRGVLSSEFFFS
jgi:DNA-directed RNA polymerase